MYQSVSKRADSVRVVEVAGLGLETHIYKSTKGIEAPTIVFLHEGLGSATMWGSFPGRIVRETGLPAVVYSRVGYGESDLRLKDYEIDFMHREALTVLPDVLTSLKIDEPILIGHSDGASIALIHAANYPVAGVVAEAPHIFVEEITVEAIKRLSMVGLDTDLLVKLGRYHNDPQHVFDGWRDIWLLPAFKDWNILDQVMRITCPILAIQGESDEYGTMAQIDGIAAKALGSVTLSKLKRCGHSPHRDQTDLVAQRIVQFIRRVGGNHG